MNLSWSSEKLTAGAMPDCPFTEIRQIFQMEDFGAEMTPELKEKEERLRAQIAKRK